MTASFDWFDQLREDLGGADLHAEFVELMKSIGIPVFVRRMDVTKKCSCLRATGEPDPLCRDCGGLGFEYDDYPALARFVHKGDILERPIEEGTYKQNRAYIVSETLFKEIDQIIEIQLTQDGRVISPYVPIRIHSVKSWRPMRGDKRGAVVFYTLELGETQRGDVKV